MGLAIVVAKLAPISACAVAVIKRNQISWFVILSYNICAKMVKLNVNHIIF